MADEKLLEKIRMLLAKAESTTYEAEADTYFEAARKLMVRHAVDQSMLDKPEDRETIVTRTVTIKKRDEIRMAKATLLNAVAKANRCQVILFNDYATIVGYDSDAEFVELLYSSVLIQYAGERNRGWKAYNGPESRYLWVNAFAQGYAARVSERFKEMARKSEAAEEPGTALVLRDRSRDVDDYVAANFRLKKTAVKYRGGEGRAAGHRAADKADLSGGRNNLRGTKALGQ